MKGESVFGDLFHWSTLDGNLCQEAFSFGVRIASNKTVTEDLLVAL